MADTTALNQGAWQGQSSDPELNQGAWQGIFEASVAGGSIGRWLLDQTEDFFEQDS